MTDSILRSYQYYTTTTIVPYPVVITVVDSALDLLSDETDGFAIFATSDPASVAVIDTGTPANNLSDVILDASNLVQSSTSAKMVHHLSSPYVRWSPHNLFLNSAVPATQNVTLVTGFVYTYGITGTGSLAGTSGASGTATAGSPVTFTASGTTGTFTVTGSPSTMWINRGEIQTPYLATSGSIRYGIPQSYDAAASKYGILVEPAGTNAALRSQELTSATPWVGLVTDITITADAAVAPDGQTTAERFLEGSSGSAVLTNNTAFAITTAASWTASFYLKRAATVQWIRFIFDDAANATNSVRGWFDIQNGVTGTVSVTGTFTNGAISMTSIGNGWYRCSVSATTGGAVTGYMWLNSASADAGNTRVNASDYYVWGAQLELGTIATSYIPTLGSTVTRAADAVSALLTTIPSISTNASLFLYGKTLKASSADAALVSLDTPGGDDIFELYANAAGASLRYYVQDGGVAQSDTNITTGYTVGNTFKLAASGAANDFQGAFNGTLGTPDVSGTMPNAMTAYRIGYDQFNSGAVVKNLFLYQAVVLKRTYSDAELQAKTT